MYFFAYVFFDLLFVPRHSLLMSTLLPLHVSKLSPWDGHALPPFLRVCSNKARRCATLLQSMAHGVSMFFISPTFQTLLHFDSPLDLVPADCVAFQQHCVISSAQSVRRSSPSPKQTNPAQQSILFPLNYVGTVHVPHGQVYSFHIISHLWLNHKRVS